MKIRDVVVIGGGVVGLATTYRFLQRYPDKNVLLLEKEARLGAHQTGHNSGVLHSGIYYRPGSLKATNCRNGKLAMQSFCEQEGIPFEICGKVIVAVCEDELEALQNIYERGQENGVDCALIDREQLTELEPHAAGIKAIHVPEAGIVDFSKVSACLGQKIEQAGGQIVLCASVRDMRHEQGGIILETDTGSYAARRVINCAGLHCDRVTRMSGQRPEARIIPFRGEYYALRPGAYRLCKNLIYPVPNPSFPFLGVHFTRMVDGSVECGPNAVLAFAREGYARSDVCVLDLLGSLSYPGLHKLAKRYWRVGLGEMWRSVNKSAFVRALQRLVPDVRIEDLTAAPAGVRAQAVMRNGAMVDDFLIQHNGRVTNVLNAPSPAATASLSIGNTIVDRLNLD